MARLADLSFPLPGQMFIAAYNLGNVILHNTTFSWERGILKASLLTAAVWEKLYVPAWNDLDFFFP